MEQELFKELIEALSEDFTLEELLNPEFMIPTLGALLNATPHEATYMAKAAAEIKELRREIKPFWKCLLNIQ